MPERPIGIFDSGIGGLTVCKAIHELLPGENLIYFGDTARFPYGTRSQDTIIRYSREITEYLISREVKMIVVACNTASAAALDELRSSYTVPFTGVIEAGARAACKRCSSDVIGVIATRATVRSESYIREIKAIRPELEVMQQQGTLFVTLTEESMTDHEIARLTSREYLQEMHASGVRTLILGCTHFPLLKNAITDVYPDMDLVDTGVEIAREVKAILREKNLAIENSDNKVGTIELYTSDITESMQRQKEIFFGPDGSEISQLRLKG